MSDPERLTLALPDGPLGVARWPGDPARLPVIALHGFTGSGLDFAPFARALGHPLVALDLLGHGASAAPRDPAAHALELQAQRLEAGRAALGIEHAALLGYSFGGRVALTWALEHPGQWLTHLVLVGATAGLGDPEARATRRREDAHLAEALERDGVAAFLDEWERRPLIATQERIEPAARAAMRSRRLAGRPESWAASLRGAGTGAMRPRWDELERLAAPALLVFGADDPKFAGVAAALHSRLSASTLGRVPGAGHCAHLEAPAACADLVRDFLAGSR